MTTEWCVTDSDGNFWEVWADTREEAVQLVQRDLYWLEFLTAQTVEEFYGMGHD